MSLLSLEADGKSTSGGPKRALPGDRPLPRPPMSTTSVHHGLGAAGSGGEGARIIRVPPDLRLSAAARIIGEQAGDPLLAARRFLDSAAQHKIDLDQMWCTLDEPARAGESRGGGGVVHVRQVVLAVIGSGRTTMLFVSGPERRTRAWSGAAKLRMLGGSGLMDARRERIAHVPQDAKAAIELRSAERARPSVARAERKDAEAR